MCPIRWPCGPASGSSSSGRWLATRPSSPCVVRTAKLCRRMKSCIRPVSVLGEGGWGVHAPGSRPDGGPQDARRSPRTIGPGDGHHARRRVRPADRGWPPRPRDARIGGGSQSHRRGHPSCRTDAEPGEARKPGHGTGEGTAPGVDAGPAPDVARSAEAPPRDASPRTEDDELETLAAHCRAKAGAARWAAERQRRMRERVEHPDEDAPDRPGDGRVGRAADRRLLLGERRRSLRARPTSRPWTTWAVASRRSPQALLLVRDARDRRGGLEKPCRCWPRPSRRCGGRSGGSGHPTTRTSWRPTSGCGRPPPGTGSSSSGSCGPTTWPTPRRGRTCWPASRPGPGAGHSRSGRGCCSIGLRSRSGRWARARDAGASWRAVIEAVEEVVGEGVPPSSREVRDLLLPHLDDLPEGADLPPGFRLVLREIDRYLATRPPGPPRRRPRSRPPRSGKRPGCSRGGAPC